MLGAHSTIYSLASGVGLFVIRGNTQNNGNPRAYLTFAEVVDVLISNIIAGGSVQGIGAWGASMALQRRRCYRGCRAYEDGAVQSAIIRGEASNAAVVAPGQPRSLSAHVGQRCRIDGGLLAVPAQVFPRLD